MSTWRALVQTRPDGALAQAVAQAGGVLDQTDLIMRQALPTSQVAAAWQQAAAKPGDWLVFSSPFTVQALGSVLEAAVDSASGSALGRDLANLVTPGLKVAAVGRATAAALERAGVAVDLVPTSGSGGAALAQELASQAEHGNRRVISLGAEVTAGTLEAGLARHGLELTSVPVYRTVPVASIPPEIAARWHRGDYDAFVATAPSVVNATALLLGTNVPAVAVGQTSLAAARKLGWPCITLAQSPNPEDVIRAILPLSRKG